MSNIEIKNLTFGYGENLIFDQAQINIDAHWRLGLVGRNGRGKTTLLRLLTGELKTQQLIKTQQQFVYFPQALTDPSRLTFYALLELADFEQWELERELTLLQVDLEVLWRPFKSLSGGEQTKVLLAILFLDNAHFPLIDEPTNHLDLGSRALVAQYLKKKSGFIVVSHNRAFLDEITDHTLAIERQEIQLYQGNFSVYEIEKKRRDAFEKTQEVKLQKDVSRLKQTAREKADWSNHREKTKDSSPDSGFVSARAARVMKKSKNLEKRMKTELSDKEKLLKNIEKIDDLQLNLAPSHHKIFLRTERFSLEIDEKTLVKPLTFELNQGEIIAITGKNGSGKSSLLRAIAGVFTGKSTGKIGLAQNLKISQVHQNTQHTGFLKDFAAKNELNSELFLSNLRKLGMERKTFEQKIENMSQGQQKKVELARSLSTPAQLYLWDEPLNYLDVFNHEQIARLLKENPVTMLLVEHDRQFIEEVCNRSIEL